MVKWPHWVNVSHPDLSCRVLLCRDEQAPLLALRAQLQADLSAAPGADWRRELQTRRVPLEARPGPLLSKLNFLPLHRMRKFLKKSNYRPLQNVDISFSFPPDVILLGVWQRVASLCAECGIPHCFLIRGRDYLRALPGYGGLPDARLQDRNAAHHWCLLAR